VVELAFLVAGLVLGAGGTWLVARAHLGAAAAAQREALGARLAGAETLADETRKQLTQRELDLAGLRSDLAAEQGQRAAAEARWEAARQSLEEQRRLLDEARAELTKSFEALSAEALRKSNDSFLTLARQALDAQLNPREEAIKGLVQPLKDSLTRYETQVRELEAARQHAYGSLEQQLAALKTSSEQLQHETGSLVTALRGSQARGRWGEITLRRVVELAGMVPYCDFDEQVSVEGESSRSRPDMVVRLPGGRALVVDAKVPLNGYLDAVKASRAEERQAALAVHARQMRAHMTQLGTKTYWAQFEQTPELVVMFIPGDSFVSAAVEADGALLQDAMTRKVVIATPTTLIGLLLAIHHGWRQAQMAESARKISDLGKELYDRVRTMGRHFEKVRRGLVQATEAYNDTVGSLERRVLPAARKFEELGAAAGDDIATLEPIDQHPRALTAPELLTQEKLPNIADPEGGPRTEPFDPHGGSRSEAEA
jgi:DNA recombination protein RmuC